MNRSVILVFVLLSLSGCRPSQQEIDALHDLSRARTQADSLASVVMSDFTDLDVLNQVTSEIELNRAIADTVGKVNEQTRDSILAQYDVILDELQLIERKAADSLAVTSAGSASDYLARVETFCSACSLSARRFLGFSLETQEPTSTSLRSVQIDSVVSLSSELEFISDSLGVLSQDLERAQSFLLSDDVQTTIETTKLNISETVSIVQEFHDHLAELIQDAGIAIERHRCEVLLSKTRSQEDIGTNIIWYHHTSAPRYTNSRSYICEISIGVRPTGGIIPSWTLGYTDPDWVFMEGVNINIDGDIHTLSFDRYQDVDDYIAGGNVSEWVHPILSENRSLLDQMVNAESVVLVFWGRQRSENRQMTSSDLTALREMLELYDLRSYMSS